MRWLKRDAPKRGSTKVVRRFAFFPKRLLHRDAHFKAVLTENGNYKYSYIWLEFYPIQYTYERNTYSSHAWTKYLDPYVLETDGSIQASTPWS